MSSEQMKAFHTDAERRAFLAGMQTASTIAMAERHRRMTESGGLRKFLCGAIEDVERKIAEQIVRLRQI